MFNHRVVTRAFDTSSPSDLAAYDRVLNNPLCSIVEKHIEKLSERAVGGEDGPTIINDRILMIVSWKEKVLL